MNIRSNAMIYIEEQLKTAKKEIRSAWAKIIKDQNRDKLLANIVLGLDALLSVVSDLVKTVEHESMKEVQSDKCPTCGAQMKAVCHDEDLGKLVTMHYECPKCNEKTN